MLNQNDLQQLIFINTLGLYTLVETFRAAQYVFLTSNQAGHAISPTGATKKRAQECYAFIQGTGLELFLQRHFIDLDADVLRDGFYAAIGQRRPD